MTDTERDNIVAALEDKLRTDIAPVRSLGSTYTLVARDVFSSRGAIPIKGICDVVDHEFATMGALTLLERAGPLHSRFTAWVYSLGMTKDMYKSQTEDAAFEEAGHALGWRLSRHMIHEQYRKDDAAVGISLGTHFWGVLFSAGCMTDVPRLFLNDHDMQILLDDQLREVYIDRAKANMISLIAGLGAVRLARDEPFGDILGTYDPHRPLEDAYGPNRPVDIDKVVLLAWFCLAMDHHEFRVRRSPSDKSDIAPVQALYREDDFFKGLVRKIVTDMATQTESLLSENMELLTALSQFLRDAWREFGQVTVPWAKIEADLPLLAN